MDGLETPVCPESPDGDHCSCYYNDEECCICGKYKPAED